MKHAQYLSFSMLFASIVFTLTLLNTVTASPLRRDAGLITLPLKRITQTRRDIHPALQLQQHVNRGLRRLALMKNRRAPTDDELFENLLKRYVIVGSDSTQHEKRYNRHGTDTPWASNHVNANNDVEVLGTSTDGNAGNNPGAANITISAPPRSIGSSTVSSASPSSTGNSTGNLAGNSTGNSAGNSTGNSAGNSTGSSYASSGISLKDIQAAQNGGLTVASPPSANNSLGLDIEANDVGYIATVQIGTPPKSFKVLADSGSADFWVGAENCQSQAGGNCGNHQLLGSKSSSSFVDTGAKFQVTYGTGNVAGDKVTDNVVVAGLSLSKHQFGVATSESQDFSDNSVPFDGIMGLAQSGLSQQGVPTPVEALQQANLISAAITSFKLGRVSDASNDGEVTFGGLDTSKFNQATLTTFNNVNQQGFWEGAMDSITVNGQDTGLKGRTAVLDTGTTLIIVPQGDANAVHQLIPGAQPDGQGGFTIPCTTTAQVALSFGGKSFAIDTQDLTFLPVNPNNPTGNCSSGIQAGQFGGPTEWLVGDVFLKNVYFSTDEGKNAISLASLA